MDPATGCQTPDLNLNGVLELDEDFPLAAWTDGGQTEFGILDMYSRPVTHALADNHVFPGSWPANIATPAEADAYWDLREAVRLYDDALGDIPGLEGMVLAGVRDHAGTAPDKPHIHQAFDGWNTKGAWVQLSPSPDYLIAADASLASRTDLPNLAPNTPPVDWTYVASYCIPKDIRTGTYQLAAVWQMADRAQGLTTPTPVGGERIT